MNIEINSKKWNALNLEQKEAFKLSLVESEQINVDDVLVPANTSAWSEDDRASNEECDMQAQWKYEMCIKAGFGKEKCADAAWDDYLSCVD